MFHRPKLDEEAREALLDYLKHEFAFAAKQTAASDQYNRALSAALAQPDQDISLAQSIEWRNVINETQVYLETMRAIVDEHQLLRPPSQAMQTFLAHDLLYRSYVHWCENRLLSYSNVNNLTSDQQRAISDADRHFVRDKKRADNSKGRLIKLLRLRPEDVQEMLLAEGVRSDR